MRHSSILSFKKKGGGANWIYYVLMTRGDNEYCSNTKVKDKLQNRSRTNTYFLNGGRIRWWRSKVFFYPRQTKESSAARHIHRWQVFIPCRSHPVVFIVWRCLLVLRFFVILDIQTIFFCMLLSVNINLKIVYLLRKISKIVSFFQNYIAAGHISAN